ncbi:MAG: ATP-binding protein [Bacteroidales bacterium]|nr:ATP-binding protein [Bacteroidales bacterium]
MTEIAVISGKGGTGKSSISAAFATLNCKVVLADCDVDAANLYLIFNPSNEEDEIYISGYKAVIDYSKCTNCRSCINQCRFDAISLINDKTVISELACDGCFLCSRICPENAIGMVPSNKSRMYSGSFRNGKMVYGRLAPGEENSGKLVNMVRSKAKKISGESGIETILLDGPPGIGCPVISTLTGVNKVVIVTEPSFSGINDMQRVMEVLRKFNLRAFIVINKYDLNVTLSARIKEWCGQNGIELAGQLPFDKNMVDAMIQGKSIIEYNPDLKISKEIHKIWCKILKTD